MVTVSDCSSWNALCVVMNMIVKISKFAVISNEVFPPYIVVNVLDIHRLCDFRWPGDEPPAVKTRGTFWECMGYYTGVCTQQQSLV